MKKTATFVYTVNELRERLKDYNADVLCPEILDEIKQAIVGDDGECYQATIKCILDENSIIKVNFRSSLEIAQALRENPLVFAPEIEHDVLNNHEFIIQVVDNVGMPVVSIGSKEIVF